MSTLSTSPVKLFEAITMHTAIQNNLATAIEFGKHIRIALDAHTDNSIFITPMFKNDILELPDAVCICILVKITDDYDTIADIYKQLFSEDIDQSLLNEIIQGL